MKTFMLCIVVPPYLLGIVASFAGAVLLFIRMQRFRDQTRSPSRSIRRRAF